MTKQEHDKIVAALKKENDKMVAALNARIEQLKRDLAVKEEVADTMMRDNRSLRQDFENLEQNIREMLQSWYIDFEKLKEQVNGLSGTVPRKRNRNTKRR